MNFSVFGSKRINVSEFVPQIQTVSVLRSTFSAYGVSVPGGSVGSGQVLNCFVFKSKRATRLALKPGIHRLPFESKRSRRGPGNGVSNSWY